MRTLMIAAAIVLSAALARPALGQITVADSDALDAIEKQLYDASKALISVRKGTPPASPSFQCYDTASQSASELGGAVGKLSELALLAALMRDQSDVATVERLAALAMTHVAEVADALAKSIGGLEGSCRQDNAAIAKLNSLLELIGRAKQTATGLKTRLSPAR